MKSCDATSSQGAGRFERTVWTDVLKAARQSEDATQAFERLAKAYWRPLYEYVRRRGHQPADAEDLVQGFFEFLIEKKPLESVDPAKGRFRAFLLGVLRNYLANQHAAACAQKRGGGQAPVSLDDLPLDAHVGPAVIDCTPDEVFDADWAEALVGQALAQLQAEYQTVGRSRVFEKLNRYLTPYQEGQVSYAAAGQEMTMSEEAVKMAVARLRRRFRELLRARIADTVSSQEDLIDEFGYLSRVLTRKRA